MKVAVNERGKRKVTAAEADTIAVHTTKVHRAELSEVLHLIVRMNTIRNHCARNRADTVSGKGEIGQVSAAQVDVGQSKPGQASDCGPQNAVRTWVIEPLHVSYALAQARNVLVPAPELLVAAEAYNDQKNTKEARTGIGRNALEVFIQVVIADVEAQRDYEREDEDNRRGNPPSEPHRHRSEERRVGKECR